MLLSCYIYFFLKINNEFVRLCSFSSNNTIKRSIDDVLSAPFGKIANFTRDNILKLKDYTFNEIASEKCRIEKLKSQIEKIEKMSNVDLNEKLEVISDKELQIDWAEDSIEDWMWANDFFFFLDNILDACRYGGESVQDDEHYIYYGLEIPNPTAEDIKESN